MAMSRPVMCWNATEVARLMKRHKIKTRGALAGKLNVPGATTYRAFAEDWSGNATTELMAAMSTRFNIPVSRLVCDPWGS
jgi:hypothetical protein